jgi:hypothetical protein
MMLPLPASNNTNAWASGFGAGGMDGLLAIESGFAAVCMVSSGELLLVVLDDVLDDALFAGVGASFLQPLSAIAVSTIIRDLDIKKFTISAPTIILRAQCTQYARHVQYQYDSV